MQPSCVLISPSRRPGDSLPSMWTNHPPSLLAPRCESDVIFISLASFHSPIITYPILFRPKLRPLRTLNMSCISYEGRTLCTSLTRAGKCETEKFRIYQNFGHLMLRISIWYLRHETEHKTDSLSVLIKCRVWNEAWKVIINVDCFATRPFIR
jgi:hypothetical protein